MSDDGFDEFAVLAWPRLRRAAYLLCGDHHLAEDLAQTALERTYASWRRVRRDDATAYARKVLVNVNIDRLRRRRPTEVPTSSVPDRAGVGRPTETVEHREEIVSLLESLTDRERRVVVLRHYFDMSEAQVAAALSMRPGTVKSTLARALSKLRLRSEHPDATDSFDHSDRAANAVGRTPS